MQKERQPAIMTVCDKTFGSIRTMIWGHRRKDGKYRFKVTTVKLVPVCSHFQGWSRDFTSEDTKDLQRASEFRKRWFRDSKIFRTLADKDQLEATFLSGMSHDNSEIL